MLVYETYIEIGLLSSKILVCVTKYSLPCGKMVMYRNTVYTYTQIYHFVAQLVVWGRFRGNKITSCNLLALKK